MIQEKSDIVFGEFLEFQEKEAKYFEYKNFIKKYESMENEEIFNFFSDLKLLDFSWHVVWNKIYTRNLILKCIEKLKEFTYEINMCEDLLFSIYFFMNAKKLSFTHGDYYIYVKHSTNITNNNTLEILEKNVNDILKIFNFLNQNLDIQTIDKITFFKCKLALIYNEILKTNKFRNKKNIEFLIKKLFNFDEIYNKKYLSKISHDKYICTKKEFKNFDLLKIKELIGNKDI